MGRSRQEQSAYLRTLICELKSHIENLRKIHEEDLKAGFGSVKLPQALSDKYQGGSKEFKWQWLFPQKNRWKNIQTGEERIRYKDNPGTSWPQRCEYNNDLYPCSKSRSRWRGKSTG